MAVLKRADLAQGTSLPLPLGHSQSDISRRSTNSHLLASLILHLSTVRISLGTSDMVPSDPKRA